MIIRHYFGCHTQRRSWCRDHTLLCHACHSKYRNVLLANTWKKSISTANILCIIHEHDYSVSMCCVVSCPLVCRMIGFAPPETKQKLFVTSCWRPRAFAHELTQPMLLCVFCSWYNVGESSYAWCRRVMCVQNGVTCTLTLSVLARTQCRVRIMTWLSAEYYRDRCFGSCRETKSTCLSTTFRQEHHAIVKYSIISWLSLLRMRNDRSRERSLCSESANKRIPSESRWDSKKPINRMRAITESPAWAFAAHCNRLRFQ